MRKLLFILFSFVVCAVYAQPNTVNIGSSANDGTGDPLRTAMQKLNANDVAAFDSISDLRSDLGSTYTAGSGLTLTSGEFEWGGFMTASTFLSNNGVYNIDIQSYDAGVRSSKLYMTDGYSLFSGYDNDSYNSTNWSALRVLGSTVTLEHNGAVNSRSISISSSAMTVSDGISEKGLIYGADYSTNYTSRSLVDKAYVDAQSGGVGGDTIQIGEIAPLKEDTVNLIDFAFTDSSQFIITRKYLLKKHVGPDTLSALKVTVGVPTGSPNFAYNIYHASDFSTAGTKLFTSDPVVTGSDATSTGEEDTPDNADIPPDHWVWVQFSDLTAKPPTGAAFSIEGYEY